MTGRWVLWGGLGLALGAAADEPPDHPALRCTLEGQQQAEGAWRLHVHLRNDGTEPLELKPGAQLVLYPDAAATESLTDTARVDRLQRSPLWLQAGATRREVLLVEPQAGQVLRCQGRRSAAAALYFYRFNPRPAFRCLLQGWAAPAAEGCG